MPVRPQTVKARLVLRLVAGEPRRVHARYLDPHPSESDCRVWRDRLVPFLTRRPEAPGKSPVPFGI